MELIRAALLVLLVPLRALVRLRILVRPEHLLRWGLVPPKAGGSTTARLRCNTP